MTSSQHPVRIIGPAEQRAAQAAEEPVVWTVSHASEDWQRDLSPFFLGPVPLYAGREARCMENAWQYAKVYASEADEHGEPTAEYWRWATQGWARGAVRYPKGKGAKPLYLLWDGQRLDYLQARQRVYWTLYRDAVRRTKGFERLVQLHERGPLTLFDFDGYDHERREMSLRDVANHAARPMGHAFVLKAMLLYGPDIAVEGLDASFAQECSRTRTVPKVSPQGQLF